MRLAIIGLTASATLLAAACTQTLVGKGAVDPAALVVYQSAASSSSASVSAAALSSKAQDVLTKVCDQLSGPASGAKIEASLMSGYAAGNSKKSMEDELPKTKSLMDLIVSRVKQIGADSDTEAGKDATDFAAAAQDVLKLFVDDQIAVDDLNQKLATAALVGAKIEKLCGG
jgi:hypothetical protein